MSQFLVDPEQLRDFSNVVSAHADSANDIVSKLEGDLDGIEDYFAGMTSSAFQGHMEEWRTSARSVTLALQSLGEFLDAEAVKAQELDEALSA